MLTQKNLVELKQLWKVLEVRRRVINVILNKAANYSLTRSLSYPHTQQSQSFARNMLDTSTLPVAEQTSAEPVSWQRP